MTHRKMPIAAAICGCLIGTAAQSDTVDSWSPETFARIKSAYDTAWDPKPKPPKDVKTASAASSKN